MSFKTRKFLKSIYNQDMLYTLGHPGCPELACVNVQVITDITQTHVILQPRSIHSTINFAQYILPVIQRKIFDDLKIDMWLHTKIYSYIEFESRNTEDYNEIHLHLIVYDKIKKTKNDFIEAWPINFQLIKDIPDLFK